MHLNIENKVLSIVMLHVTRKLLIRGLTQGSVSVPYLFIIFLNDLVVKIGAEPAIIMCRCLHPLLRRPVMKGHDFSPRFNYAIRRLD